MIQKRLAGILLIALVIVGNSSQHLQLVKAESFSSPLVFLMKGDLFTWSLSDSKLTQLTHYGYNYEPVISPDGKRIAYKSLAEVAIPANKVDAGNVNVYLYAPQNIWVWDLASGQSRRVAAQPSSIRHNPSSGVWQNALMRSTPAWSPDSNKLAWVEATLPDNKYRLVVYDFTADASKTLTSSLPTPYDNDGQPSMFNLQWAAIGLGMTARVGRFSGEGLGDFPTVLIDAQGKTLAAYPLSDAEFGAVWASYGKRVQVAFLDHDFSWQLSDPLTQQQTWFDYPALELYSPTAGNSAAYTVRYTQSQSEITWTVFDNAGVGTSLPYTGSIWDGFRLTLDPTGQAVAYTADDGVYVWRNATANKIAGTESISKDTNWIADGAMAWGIIGWRPISASNAPTG